MGVRDNFLTNTPDLEPIRNLNAIGFERFVGELFQRMGYQVHFTRSTGDEGVDILVRCEDRTAAVQCKNLRGTVSQSAVRDLYGAMMDKRVKEAYLVTSGMISKPAREWVTKDNKPIHLVDGLALLSWIRQYESPHTGVASTDATPQKALRHFCRKCERTRDIWVEKEISATRQISKSKLITGRLVQGLCVFCYSKVEIFLADPEPPKKGWIERLFGGD